MLSTPKTGLCKTVDHINVFGKIVGTTTCSPTLVVVGARPMDCPTSTPKCLPASLLAVTWL